MNLSVDAITVTLRRSARTRRMALKLDPLLGPLLVIPLKTSLGDAQTFLNSNKSWLEQCLAKIPAKVSFAVGATLPIGGIDHRISHAPQARRGVWIDQQNLHVCGDQEHIPRRVQDFLKAESLRRIRPIAFDFSAKIDRTPTRITVRTLKSRWGSCSSAGDLSFSWRLIMAPPNVLDYVVAHEVAHLAQMNHSPAFWSIVATLLPDYKTPQQWLKINGTALFRFGS
jgi:predicted metal-dependent hydrolase